MRLSVVVTIVDGKDALERCLHALASQAGDVDLDVIVPWDASVPGITALEARFPAVRFLPLGSLETARPAQGAAGQHELFDRRRSAGLAAAGGDVIAMLEDRGIPRSDWARRLVAAHERLPHAVIGGAIDNGVDRPLAWAVFFCDFNRYQPPFEAGPREYVSDVNISYKRRALERTADIWAMRYQETSVHWALRRAGETLHLTPECVVDQQRLHITAGRLCAERFAWGRLFACTRVRETSGVLRWLLIVAAPVLPVLLFVRHARLQVSRRVTFGRFLCVSPLVAVLLAVWSAGECAGYLTRRP